MSFDNVYYFHVHYGFDLDGWQEKDEYGFIAANDFEEAFAQLKRYYGDDIISYTLEYIGDTGIISIGNVDLATSFRQAFIDCHYGSGREDEE